MTSISNMHHLAQKKLICKSSGDHPARHMGFNYHAIVRQVYRYVSELRESDVVVIIVVVDVRKSFRKPLGSAPDRSPLRKRL